MRSSEIAARASGGIGRRAGFRCQCPKGRGGSTPPSRTIGGLLQSPRLCRAVSRSPTVPTKRSPFGVAFSGVSGRDQFHEESLQYIHLIISKPVRSHDGQLSSFLVFAFLPLPMALWFAFVLWLGTVGSGVRLSVVAFALVLTCASFMTPVSLIGAASGRRSVTWVLPLALLALSLGAYFVINREVFRASPRLWQYRRHRPLWSASLKVHSKRGAARDDRRHQFVTADPAGSAGSFDVTLTVLASSPDTAFRLWMTLAVVLGVPGILGALYLAFARRK